MRALECPTYGGIVKALSLHDRFVIALHSPDGVGEIGLCPDPAEESAREGALGFDETLSPVRLEGKNYGIAAIFSDSCRNTD